MNPNTDPDGDPRKPPKNPFDDIMRGFGFSPDDFDRVFQEMQKALQDMMKQGGFEPGKPYVHGFSFKIGPDGKPIVSEFGNKTQKPAKGYDPQCFRKVMGLALETIHGVSSTLCRFSTFAQASPDLLPQEEWVANCPYAVDH